MTRALPLFVVLILGASVVSMLAGFLLASWTLAGIAPAYAAPAAFARSEPRVAAKGWREAGYARIGLWEQPEAETHHAEGSSRL